MNGKKIVITARNFDMPDAGALKMLEESGFTVIDHSAVYQREFLGNEPLCRKECHK